MYSQEFQYSLSRETLQCIHPSMKLLETHLDETDLLTIRTRRSAI